MNESKPIFLQKRNTKLKVFKRSQRSLFNQALKLIIGFSLDKPKVINWFDPLTQSPYKNVDTQWSQNIFQFLPLLNIPKTLSLKQAPEA